MTTKIPTYFLFTIYVIICLLGNVFTVMVCLKHYQVLGDNQQENTSTTLNNETLLPLMLSEKTEIDESGLVLDEDTRYRDFNFTLPFLGPPIALSW